MHQPLDHKFTVNPFVKRDNYDKSSVFFYRALTVLSWLLVVLLAVVYTIDDPSGAKTIQGQNEDHPTPFSLNAYVICLYWLSPRLVAWIRRCLQL